jgi:hypothetical protein
MATKAVKIEKSDPTTFNQALEIVQKVKRSLGKKTSVTKIATELATHLQNIKKEG